MNPKELMMSLYAHIVFLIVYSDDHIYMYLIYAESERSVCSLNHEYNVGVCTIICMYQDTIYKIQDILLSFCAYNYTHIRQSIQEHNIHKYTIQTQKLQILYKLNCFAVPDKHIQKHI